MTEIPDEFEVDLDAWPTDREVIRREQAEMLRQMGPKLGWDDPEMDEMMKEYQDFQPDNQASE